VSNGAVLTLQPDFTEEAVVPLPMMPYGETGSTFVVLGRPEGALALGKFTCKLRFTVKEIDPSTGLLRRGWSLKPTPGFEQTSI
jgi:Coatomer gamma subunit appendage platform subdomain